MNDNPLLPFLTVLVALTLIALALRDFTLEVIR